MAARAASDEAAAAAISGVREASSWISGGSPPSRTSLTVFSRWLRVMLRTDSNASTHSTSMVSMSS